MEGSPLFVNLLFCRCFLVFCYLINFFTPHKTPHVKNQASCRGSADRHKPTQLIDQMFDLNVEHICQ